MLYMRSARRLTSTGNARIMRTEGNRNRDGITISMDERAHALIRTSQPAIAGETSSFCSHAHAARARHSRKQIRICSYLAQREITPFMGTRFRRSFLFAAQICPRDDLRFPAVHWTRLGNVQRNQTLIGNARRATKPPFFALSRFPLPRGNYYYGTTVSFSNL